MVANRQEACAQNNALWCDAVLKAAGAKTHFHSAFWNATGKTLPLYPNLVTTSPKTSADLDAALARLPVNAAVKDSFDTLDLSRQGFKKLFQGTWLFRPPVSAKKASAPPCWHQITHAESLKKWLHEWNSKEALHSVFPNRLLEDSTVSFAAIHKDSVLKAGAVFNSGPSIEGKDILGISNLFYRKSWRYSALHDLMEPFPHKAICCYETDPDILPVYSQLGFEPCGTLTVWLRTSQPSSTETG
ncbi:hypothetical protein E1180_07175 [Roseibium denhamense]|uniref:N-acetyltransferase domain-containing protein n=1 Tax=Roseibium denhamense TaxID=76305 RepID=A0ABY1PC08_9HYPH|nr:hypothetical protein [Roseibium denhamense]MTI05294.1 hypothetical protein [Roseibium denhamense]SMP30499.1 hypothetical protein SAMN06265374_3264 [Roseibium denhamense]